MTDSTPSPPLLEARDGTTLVLTLNATARRNALSMPLRAALIEAFDGPSTIPACLPSC